VKDVCVAGDHVDRELTGASETGMFKNANGDAKMAQDGLKEKVRKLPLTPGVYLMKDRFGNVIYVGKAKSLKKRVSTYFQASRRDQVSQPKVRSMLPLIADFDWIEVQSETEALILEGKLLKEYKPRYNTDFVDDKHFLMVQVDLPSPIPAFRLVRHRIDSQSLYYGPFVHAVMLKKTLSELRLRFGIVLGDARPVEIRAGVFRLYDDVRRELYGHEAEVTVEQYRARVDQACAFLDGKAKEWIAELEQNMRERAEARDYEQAARLRDVIQSMRATLERSRKFTRTASLRQSPDGVLERLGEVLSLEAPPRHVECFDISHTSGKFVVASMVCFRDGKPSRADYRRFRIKGDFGNDDFRSMEEVVGRRYQRLHREQRPLPDLIIIDGGKGQVGAAMRAFLVIGLEPPPLIGLAKQFETIIFPDQRAPMNLPVDDPALFLLQRVRDEAHRFANTFNADLRSKKLRESVLDEVEGLGAARRKALLAHFGSVARIRKASLAQIEEVDGVGPKLAAAIHARLHVLSQDAGTMDNESLPEESGSS
jgi:excinuclease ABC subunit C